MSFNWWYCCGGVLVYFLIIRVVGDIILNFAPREPDDER